MEMGWRVIRNYPCKCVTIVRFVCCSMYAVDLLICRRIHEQQCTPQIYNMHAFVKWLCFFFSLAITSSEWSDFAKSCVRLHCGFRIPCISSLHMSVTHLCVSIKLHIWFPVCVTLFHYSYCFLLSACRCSIAIHVCLFPLHVRVVLCCCFSFFLELFSALDTCVFVYAYFPLSTLSPSAFSPNQIN